MHIIIIPETNTNTSGRVRRMLGIMNHNALCSGDLLDMVYSRSAPIASDRTAMTNPMVILLRMVMDGMQGTNTWFTIGRNTIMLTVLRIGYTFGMNMWESSESCAA